MAADTTVANPVQIRQRDGNMDLGATGALFGNGGRGTPIMSFRRRCTLAELNAGVTLLPAVAGQKYRMVGCKMIAYGGAVGALATADILATQAAGSVKLVAFAQASLTQSAVLSAGGTGAAVLADGASHVANDVNTAITLGKTGSTATTATGVDVILDYVIEEA